MLPPGLLGEIDARLPALRRPFAVFDFDNTCIVGDIGEATWEHFIHTGRLDAAMNERYDALIAQGKLKEAYVLYGTIASGLTEAELVEAAEAAIREAGSAMTVRPEVMALMELLKEKGVAIWIISASHEAAVRVAMRHFGIEANLIGIRNLQEGGRYTAALEKPAPMFEGKVACMRASIDPAEPPLLVIDDNASGLPLLREAVLKVVLAHDPALQAEAKREGWFILQ